jgi:hypothetical protein
MSRQPGNTFIRTGTVLPNGSTKDTAVLLIGMAEEWGFPYDSVFASSGGFYVSDDLAAVLVSEGLLPYDEGMSPAPEPRYAIEPVSGNEPDTTEDETYDPADFTVEAVKETLMEIADTEFAQSVLDAEIAGKNRTTLIVWITDYLAQTTEASATTTPEEE